MDLEFVTVYWEIKSHVRGREEKMFYFILSVIVLTVIYKNMPVNPDTYFIGFAMICSALILHNLVGTYRNKTAEEFDWEDISSKVHDLSEKLEKINDSRN